MTLDLHAVAPEIVLAATALVVLVADLYAPRRDGRLPCYLSIAGTVIAAVALASLAGSMPRTAFGGSFVVDRYAVAFKGLFLGALLLVLLMSERHLPDSPSSYSGEFYFLLLSASVGTLLMPSSRDLLMLFLSLEIVSATGFILAGFRKGDARSNEGALKFLLIGLLSTAVMLFGMTLVYGFTGSLQLAEIAPRLAALHGEPAVVLAVLLVVTGFGFKVSAAPFHFWAPDAYEGAPVPVAAFLSVSSKAAGFAGLLELTFLGFPGQARWWAPALGAIAAFTMLVGNVIALAQTNMVRLLAYSSIAQAGYLLVPFAAGSAGVAVRNDAFQAVLVYLVIYAITNVGAFAVVDYVGRRRPGNLLVDYAGLGRESPALGLAMSVFLFSLAGLPPAAGWYAKVVVFRAALGAGEPLLAGLAIFMGVMTVVAFFYYVGVVRTLWLAGPARDPLPPPPRAQLPRLAIALTAVAVLVLGVIPNVAVHWAPTSTLVASR